MVLWHCSLAFLLIMTLQHSKRVRKSIKILIKCLPLGLCFLLSVTRIKMPSLRVVTTVRWDDACKHPRMCPVCSLYLLEKSEFLSVSKALGTMHFSIILNHWAVWVSDEEDWSPPWASDVMLVLGNLWWMGWPQAAMGKTKAWILDKSALGRKQ